ncbi:MAG: cell envelope integrity protein TolA [Paucibacter sp.]|nr:cell envelope integrity protein TolA [Roseateles sp.]
MASLFLRPTDPLRPPETPLLGRGLLFAIVAHALLVLALSAGVNWRTKAPPAFEAELWSAVPQAAAPKEVIPPTPEAEPEVVTKPTPKPQPVEDTAQAERDAEIAIARDRKKKIAAELELERKKREALDAKAKLDQELKEDKLKQAKLDKDKKDKQLKQDKELQAKQDAKQEAQRQENLRRIQGMAGASGAPNASGTALKSSGPSASYGGRIKAVIRPNIIFTDTPVGNPMAEVEVRVAPNGSIISRKLLKPSGDAEWDKTVLRAIDKTEMLPRDVDGRVPPVLVISFQPLD